MSELEIFDCEQGTPEWLACRAGFPTMSEADTIQARGVKGGESKTRRTYMYKLAGEVITGEPAENYTNMHMARGHALEPDARNLYSMVKDVELKQVGFMRRGRAGCSPDSLVGADGLLEIKTKLPHLQIEVLLADAVPSEHIPQLQGQLWISGREWVDFVSYWPGLPLFVKRVHRDEAYMETLSRAVGDFISELDALVARIRSYKAPKKAAKPVTSTVIHPGNAQAAALYTPQSIEESEPF